MTRKNLNLIPTIGLLAVTLLMSCSQDAESGAAKSDDKSARAEKQPREVSELTCLDELHERKNFNSYDRSIKDYLKSKPNLPTGEKHVVYLLPFGNMKPQVEEIIQAEVDYLSTFLQMEVRVMERLSYDQIKGMTAVKTRMVPDGDYVRYGKMKGEQYVRRNLREQIEANSFIEHYVTPNMPKDAIAVLGVTEHDIYKPNYNYLFGTSKIKGGVGLVSTFRLVDYGQETRDNIRKVMSKQIVNMFSIRNVEDYECLLNFHRNKAELEDGLFQLSPIALEKLGHALGFNHEQRFSELEKLWEEEGYTWMADYYIRGRELLAQTEKEQNKTDAKDHP